MNRFKTRFGYAMLAFFVAALVIPILTLIMFVFGVSDAGIQLPSLVSGLKAVTFTSFPAAISAAVCWPYKTRRTKKRMALAGVLTVGLAFILMGLIGSLAESGLSNPLPGLMASVMFFLFGSVISLGIPYVMGALASLPFADNAK